MFKVTPLFFLTLFFICNCTKIPSSTDEKIVRSQLENLQLPSGEEALTTHPKKQTICLNMIVKNESHVIKRCLDSAKKLIDYWVIVDTGSTDETQEIIQAHMKGIPGELHERPWINWGETRTEALQLAKGKADYILFMDADDILEFEDDEVLPALTEDLYSIWRGTQTFSYLQPQLAKDDLSWKWIGVTHEYLGCDTPYTSGVLEKLHYTTLNDGATRLYDSRKYQKNIELLEDGLKKEPDNVRYAFYLAESYRDAGEKAKALEWYQKRIQMGGWEEELFWSKLQIGHMLKHLGLSDNVAAEAYKDALMYRPHRIESYYYLAEIYNQQNNYSQAYTYIKAQEFATKPKVKDYLFNEDWIQDFGLLFQLSICAYYVGNYEEALKACDQLLTNKNLPESWREQVKVNRQFPMEKLKNQKIEDPVEMSEKETGKETALRSAER